MTTKNKYTISSLKKKYPSFAKKWTESYKVKVISDLIEDQVNSNPVSTKISGFSTFVETEFPQFDESARRCVAKAISSWWLNNQTDYRFDCYRDHLPNIFTKKKKKLTDGVYSVESSDGTVSLYNEPKKVTIQLEGNSSSLTMEFAAHHEGKIIEALSQFI
jgi:hypothetical protein